MLTILYPDLLPAIHDYPVGLCPIRNTETGKLLLVVKTHKEYILAARLKGGFSFYLAPLQSTSGLTVALATAFTEDDDEPLVIRTPLFDEPLSNDLLELLTYDEVEVYFFDEHSREMIGHKASLLDTGSLITKGAEFELLTYHPQTVTSIHENLNNWFGLRNSEDDANAIKVVFKEELYPSDILILDTCQANHDYRGSAGFSFSSLERENPGYYQERDIVIGLKRALSGEQIMLNPRRRDSGNEFVDVLAVNDTHLLLVQAKDSPNTEASLSLSIDRKRRKSQSQIEKAVKQAKGAAAYLRKLPKLELIIDKNHFDIELETKKIVSLVVVKEMFTDEGNSFVERYTEMQGTGDVFVMLDYAAFNAFSHEFQSERLLLSAFEDYNAKILAEGIWIDPRTYVLEFTSARLNKLI